MGWGANAKGASVAVQRVPRLQRALPQLALPVKTSPASAATHPLQERSELWSQEVQAKCEEEQ